MARMAVLPSTPREPGDVRSPGSVASPSEILRPAEGVQLLGEAVGSGYRQPPALVRRADGQVIQLTPLLHLVLSHIDGARTVDQVAAVVGKRPGAVKALQRRALAALRRKLAPDDARGVPR